MGLSFFSEIAVRYDATMPDLAQVKDISIVIAGVVAFVTFAFGLGEYIKRGRQERAVHFVEMRRRFLETTAFRDLLEMLHNQDPRLRTSPIQDKRNFIGFFEEVALMVNSGLLRKDVAHYMYGHYVILANDSDDFWNQLDRPSVYWTLFRKFATDMQAEQTTPHRERLAI